MSFFGRPPGKKNFEKMKISSVVLLLNYLLGWPVACCSVTGMVSCSATQLLDWCVIRSSVTERVSCPLPGYWAGLLSCLSVTELVS